MQLVDDIIIENKATVTKKKTTTQTLCFHCGTPCITNSIAIEEKYFCCDGCKLVYEILNTNGLCDYYKIQNHPGLSQITPIRQDKYAYLDNEEIAKQLYQFSSDDLAIVTFYIPGVHCSSCMWLLEHLKQVNAGIIESRLNFTNKEVTIRFLKNKISLRKTVELLATIGYEPYISLDDANKKKTNKFNKQRLYKLGIAGFCFGNVMMMSFPEYLSTNLGIEQQYAHLFRYFNLFLALPVFFYSSTEFFSTAWKGIKQKTLNIDAPIALAIIITFGRSVFEILFNLSGGYLDSMCGIVFFMLVGRVVQERTYKSISFTRDYKSYFPIAVNVVTPTGVETRKLQDLKEKDVVQIYNDEIIPADSIVVKGKACIDYSFVTGESEPLNIKPNELVYAGGKQVGEQLTIQIVKPVAGSYLTSLWNHHAFGKNKIEKNDDSSIIHILSKNYTYILLGLVVLTGLYWYMHNPGLVVNSITAMLVVACPCALLLAATYTNGNLLRILSNNGLYLRDATVIEQIGKIQHIVFDKTGTVTHSGNHHFNCTGHQLTQDEKDLLFSVVYSSKHPYSKALVEWLGKRELFPLTEWKEIPGKGLEAWVMSNHILVGSAEWVGINNGYENTEKASVYTSINGKITAYNLIAALRDAIPQIIPVLNHKYQLSLLSGDNDKQKGILKELFGKKSELLFEQKPIDKLNYIENLQKNGTNVMMIGDGLNDAGALQQSNVGITLADDINNFTPSCDAILDAKQLYLLPSFLKLAKAGGQIINLSFVVSILYNIVGLYFSMQGMLQPIRAAILMPCSTLSIVLLTSGVSSLVAKRLGLTLKVN